MEYGIIYGQNNTASVANADRKNSTVMGNGQSSRRRRAPAKTPNMAASPIAGKINPHRSAKKHRADDPISFGDRGHGGRGEHHEHSRGQTRHPRPCPFAQPALGLQHEPACAEQRVAQHEAEAGEHGQRREPLETAPRILPVHDRDAADHGADRRALNESDDRRTEEETPSPTIRARCPGSGTRRRPHGRSTRTSSSSTGM